MTIYLDAVWLLNFFLDWMILMLTHSFAKASNHRARLILGAIVASLLVPLNLFYPTSLWTTPIGKGIFSLIIVFTAFGFKNIRLYTRQLLLFYFTSFAMGGGLFGIYYLLQEQIHVSNGMVVTYQSGFGDSISWLFVVIGFPLIWWFTKQRLDNLVIQQMKYDEMVHITICMQNQINNSSALIDSGNQLVDPVTKQPVVICDEIFMKKWFSEEEWVILQDVQENMSLERLPDKWLDKFRIVPYQGVGGAGNFLLVLKPDWIQVTVQEQQLTITRALVGLQFGELSPDGSYHCLMHPHLLKSLAVHSA